MKRKRSISGTKYKCRLIGCKLSHDDLNEPFCLKHRGVFEKNSKDIYYSTKSDITFPVEVIVKILLYNIPFKTLIEQDTRKTISYSSTKGAILTASLLKAKDVNEILYYFTTCSWISKTISPIFYNQIKDYYCKIYVFDEGNQKIYDKKLSTGSTDILKLYIDLSKKTHDAYIPPEKYKDYYINKFNASYLSRKSKNQKEDVNKIILSWIT